MIQQENLTIRPVEERDLAFLQLAQTQGMRGRCGQHRRTEDAGTVRISGGGGAAQVPLSSWKLPRQLSVQLYPVKKGSSLHNFWRAGRSLFCLDGK